MSQGPMHSAVGQESFSYNDGRDENHGQESEALKVQGQRDTNLTLRMSDWLFIKFTQMCMSVLTHTPRQM